MLLNQRPSESDMVEHFRETDKDGAKPNYDVSYIRTLSLPIRILRNVHNSTNESGIDTALFALRCGLCNLGSSTNFRTNSEHHIPPNHCSIGREFPRCENVDEVCSSSESNQNKSNLQRCTNYGLNQDARQHGCP